MTVANGRGSRRERVREIMDGLGLGAIVLRQPANFAWYTGGADNRVDHASPVGVADLVVTVDDEYVFTNTIEARRMREEQTPDIEVIEHPWYGDPTPTLRDLSGGNALGSDASLHDAVDVSLEIAPLRYRLDPDAIEQYRLVGALTVEAMSQVAAKVSPEMTEDEAAARLSAACRERGLYSPVIMAAGSERLARYRHPIPQPGAILGARVMLVVCAERGGLYACLTRFVHFDEPDAELQRRFDACDTILKHLHDATRPGRSLSDVFEDCRRFYADAGFPDEWKLHHQGGMTGYATREVVATPSTRQEIEIGQAFAWNPSITGAKAEDTYILTEDGAEVIAAYNVP